MSDELGADGHPQHWAVVGGGMLGLTTAWRLIHRGFRVTLLEAGPELGGLTSAWSVGDVVWDRFYHVILNSDSHLRALLADIGLESEISWIQTRTGFYTDGKLYSLSSSVEFLKFPPLSLFQKFRLGGTIFYASKLKDWRRLEQIPVEKWLRSLSGNSTFEKIWLPLLKAKLGDAYKRTSAAFIWSYIDRMYKARRSGMKREMFGYIPGGYCRILETFAEKLKAKGASIRTSSPVQVVQKDNASGKLVVHYGRDHTVESFDRVVMTVPNPVILASCRGLSEGERQSLAATEYLGVVCTSMLLDRPLTGYYVTNITDGWVPLTGIIEMTAIVDPKHLGGKHLIYLPRYLMSDSPGFDESDEQVHQRCVATLEKMHPQFRREQVLGLQTARARYVMALPTMNYSKNLPSVRASVPGLYLLNSSQITKGNLNVNETIEVVDSHIGELA